MMLPFTLLGGWLEFRFYYISAALLTLYAGMVAATVVALLRYFVTLRFPKAQGMDMAGTTVILLIVMGVIVSRARAYVRDVTLPNQPFKPFVENYVRGMTALRSRFPAEREFTLVVFENEQRQLCSRYMYYSECWLTISADWVGKGLKSNGLAPEGAEIFYVRSMSFDENNVALMPRAPSDLVPAKVERLRRHKSACLFKYDGERLTPMRPTVLRAVDGNSNTVHEWTVDPSFCE
jgi:hypothetical protein